MKQRILAILLAAILFTLSGCGTVTVGSLSDPQSDIDAFFAALSEEDYDTADRYIYNYATLGFASEPGGDELSAIMSDAVTDSRSYRIIDCSASGREAHAEIELSTLDLRKLSKALEDAVAQEVSDRRLDGDPCDSADDILAITGQLLPELLRSESDYLTTDSFSLDLIYEDGRWNIIVTDELYCALIGYAL